MKTVLHIGALFLISMFLVGTLLNGLALALIQGPPPPGLVGGWTLIFSIILTRYWYKRSRTETA